MNRPSLLLFAALMLTVRPIFAADELDQEVNKSTLVKVGQTAPNFTCKTTDGRTITLSELRGQVVVLYFFATQMKASFTELRRLEEEVFKNFRGQQGFQLIAIGRDLGREELVKIAGENKLSYPVVADPTRELYAKYFSGFVPRTIVVGGSGTITYLNNGYRDFDGIPNLQAMLVHELKKLKR